MLMTLGKWIEDVRRSEEVSIGLKTDSVWSDEESDPDGDGGKDADPVELEELPRHELERGEYGSALMLYDSGEDEIPEKLILVS